MESSDLLHALVYNSASIASQLEKIVRDFLCSEHDSDDGFHWVSWDEICCPEEDGGLGIRPLRAMSERVRPSGFIGLLQKKTLCQKSDCIQTWSR